MLHAYWAWVGINWAWVATADVCYWCGLWIGNRQGRRAERRRFLRWMDPGPLTEWPRPNEFPGLLTMPEGWVEEGRN